MEADFQPEKSDVKFSRAEAPVHKLLMEGLPTKEIAEKLFVTEKTIKGHLTSIYKKLGIRGRRDINFLGVDQ